MDTLSKYRKAQKTFGKLFLVSCCVFFVSLLLSPLFVFQSFQSPASNTAFSNSSTPETDPTVYDTPLTNDTPSETTNTSIDNTNSASYNRPLNKNTNKSLNNTAPKISPKMTPAVTGESGFPFVLAAFLVTGTFSLLATVFTFLGFLTMTIFAWRKEKREAASFRLENQKKAIEIEKLKIELEQSKGTTAGNIKKCTVCNRSYSDISLNFCLDDGAVLSDTFISEEVRQNPFEKTQIMEGNLPTEQISAKTEEINNKNTAK